MTPIHSKLNLCPEICESLIVAVINDAYEWPRSRKQACFELFGRRHGSSGLVSPYSGLIRHTGKICRNIVYIVISTFP